MEHGLQPHTCSQAASRAPRRKRTASAWTAAKPIRVIVSYAAGGGADTLIRVLSPKLPEALGQSVVIENRTGGSGLIATVPNALAVNPSFAPQTVKELLALVKSSLGKYACGCAGNGSAAFPNVPTLMESGLPQFESYEWNALFAPAGTPTAITERIAREINKIMQLPEIKERFAGLSADAIGSTPEALDQFRRKEIVQWAGVIKRAGIRLE